MLKSVRFMVVDDARKSVTIRTDQKTIVSQVDEVTQCPLCGTGIAPNYLISAYYHTRQDDCDIPAGVCLCVCPSCNDAFFVKYDFQDQTSTLPLVVAPKNHIPRKFDPVLNDVSPKFIEIYNQAEFAEINGLNEISGMAYRKALEFLIKDYIIRKEPDGKSTIEEMTLSNCIANKVVDKRIQDCATGATWLGNDFSHYKRRHSEYEIEDLKAFIDATVYWIMMECRTDTARAFRDSCKGQCRQSVPRPSSSTE